MKWTQKQIKIAENDSDCLINHLLDLCIEFEDYGESNSATVSNIENGACSSMACAEHEGTLENEGVDYPLTSEQLDWLGSEEVTEWLESKGY